MLDGPDAVLRALGGATVVAAVERVAPPPDLAAVFEASDAYARRHHLMDVRLMSDSLAGRVAASLAHGELPIVLGGDHTVAIGGFAGVRRAFGWERRLGLVWIDAHPDLNTPETTPSNHGHGMPLAALLGLGHPLLVNAGGLQGRKLEAGDVALVGARSIDPGEALFLAQHPELRVAPARTIREAGLLPALRPLLEWARQLDGLYLSFDLDAVDPSDAPGVTTPVRGGLSAAEGVETVRLFAATGKVVAGDVVEHFPARDPAGRTAQLAASLVEALGAAPSVA